MERKDIEDNPPKKLIKEIEHTNCKRVENRPILGEILTDYELYNIDWDKVLKDHQENLEKEIRQRKETFEQRDKKLKHWELYKECKMFLEDNDKNWQNKKIERDLERKRKERLDIVEKKREKVKEKVQKRKLEEEIRNKMNILPTKEREKIERDEKRKERLDLIETKKSLWKFRSKEKKEVHDTERTSKLNNLETLEEKLMMIEKILEELREEKRKFTEDQKSRKEKIDKEWREKLKQKYKKEAEKKEQLQKQKMKSQHWEMLRWVTDFINKNQEDWERKRKIQEEEIERELEQWNKCKRFDKIRRLKENWNSQKNEKLDVLPPPLLLPRTTDWENWRKGCQNTKVIDPVSHDSVEEKSTNNTVLAVRLSTPKLRYCPPANKKTRMEDSTQPSPQYSVQPPRQEQSPHSTRNLSTNRILPSLETSDKKQDEVQTTPKTSPKQPNKIEEIDPVQSPPIPVQSPRSLQEETTKPPAEVIQEQQEIKYNPEQIIKQPTLVLDKKIEVKTTQNQKTQQPRPTKVVVLKPPSDRDKPVRRKPVQKQSRKPTLSTVQSSVDIRKYLFTTPKCSSITESQDGVMTQPSCIATQTHVPTCIPDRSVTTSDEKAISLLSANQDVAIQEISQVQVLNQSESSISNSKSNKTENVPFTFHSIQLSEGLGTRFLPDQKNEQHASEVDKCLKREDVQ